jgi:hypothetical protein
LSLVSTIRYPFPPFVRYTEPVKIYWEGRNTACPAIIIPGADNILLGAISLEDMDLIVDPQGRQLVGAHGDEVVCLIK